MACFVKHCTWFVLTDCSLVAIFLPTRWRLRADEAGSSAVEAVAAELRSRGVVVEQV